MFVPVRLSSIHSTIYSIRRYNEGLTVRGYYYYSVHNNTIDTWNENRDNDVVGLNKRRPAAHGLFLDRNKSPSFVRNRDVQICDVLATPLINNVDGAGRFSYDKHGRRSNNKLKYSN